MGFIANLTGGEGGKIFSHCSEGKHCCCVHLEQCSNCPSCYEIAVTGPNREDLQGALEIMENFGFEVNSYRNRGNNTGPFDKYLYLLD